MPGQELKSSSTSSAQPELEKAFPQTKSEPIKPIQKISVTETPPKLVKPLQVAEAERAEMKLQPAATTKPVIPVEPKTMNDGVTGKLVNVKSESMTSLSMLKSPKEVLLEQCGAELVDGVEGEFSLRLKIPQAVSSIELLRASDESMVIDLDKANRAPSAIDDASDRMTQPVDELTNFDSSLTDVSQDNLPVATVDEAGFQLNPFFDQAAVKEKTVQSKSFNGPTSAHFDDNGIANVGAQTAANLGQPSRHLSGAAYHQAPLAAMEQPEVDIRRLVRQKPSALTEHQTMGAMIPVNIEAEGPTVMHRASSANFLVRITNRSEHDVKDFDVRLSLPKGLRVTVVDRIAHYDAKLHTLTWSFQNLSQEETIKLQYQAESMTDGRHTQSFETGREGRFGNLTTISTSTFR